MTKSMLKLIKSGSKRFSNLSFCKYAFTLAEVLITIAIIGIVAILTIPGMIAKYQKFVVETRLKKAYVTFTQAIQLAIAEYGSPKYWDYPNTGDEAENNKLYIEKYILPYFKTIEFCDTGMTAEKCAKYVGCGYAARNYVLADGTMMSICAYHPGAGAGTHNEKASLTFTIKKSNDRYKSKFSFSQSYSTGEILPNFYDRTKTREDYKNGFDTGYGYSIGCCKNCSVEYPGHACTALIFIDGFKIKDDYPW